MRVFSAFMGRGGGESMRKSPHYRCAPRAVPAFEALHDMLQVQLMGLNAVPSVSVYVPPPPPSDGTPPGEGGVSIGDKRSLAAAFLQRQSDVALAMESLRRESLVAGRRQQSSYLSMADESDSDVEEPGSSGKKGGMLSSAWRPPPPPSRSKTSFINARGAGELLPVKVRPRVPSLFRTGNSAHGSSDSEDEGEGEGEGEDEDEGVLEQQEQVQMPRKLDKAEARETAPKPLNSHSEHESQLRQEVRVDHAPNPLEGRGDSLPSIVREELSQARKPVLNRWATVLEEQEMSRQRGAASSGRDGRLGGARRRKTAKALSQRVCSSAVVLHSPEGFHRSQNNNLPVSPLRSVEEDGTAPAASGGTNSKGIAPILPYSVLVKARGEGLESVDSRRKEDHLSDAEFALVFGIDRNEFDSLPGWKRTSKKKAVGLF